MSSRSPLARSMSPEDAAGGSARMWIRIWAGALGVSLVVLYGKGLSVGFLADDLFQISMLEGLFGEYSIAHLYAFAPGDPDTTASHIARGSLPWWTHPNFRFVMLRPLSSLLLAFDHWLWPRAPFVQHLHSALWFAVMLALAFRLTRSLTTPAIAATVITIFAVDETMTWMVAWLANRCAMVCTTFAFVAILLRVRDDRDAKGSPLFGRRRILEFAAWTLAFCGGEYAVAGVAYFFAYQVMAGRGRLVHRLAGLWPALLALTIFSVAYLSIHGGVYGNTSYIDPLGETSAFVRAAFHRVPRMLGEVWLSVSGESDHFWLKYETSGVAAWVMPHDGADHDTQAFRHARFAVVSTLVVIPFTWWLARPHLSGAERRTMRWTALGSVLSLLPMAAIPPATRSLLLPNFGASIFVGCIIVAAVRAWRSPALVAAKHVRRVALGIIVLALVGFHVVLEVAYVREVLGAMARVQTAYEEFYRNPGFEKIDLRDKHVVVIAAPGLVSGIHGMSMLNVLGYDTPKTWHVLGVGGRAYTLRVAGPRAIELAPVGGPMHGSAHEQLFRSPDQALRTGEVVEAGVFRAKVLADYEGAGPGATLFKFQQRLSDPHLLFLEVGPDGLRRFALPQPGKMVGIKPPTLPGIGPRG